MIQEMNGNSPGIFGRVCAAARCCLLVQKFCDLACTKCTSILVCFTVTLHMRTKKKTRQTIKEIILKMLADIDVSKDICGFEAISAVLTQPKSAILHFEYIKVSPIPFV